MAGERNGDYWPLAPGALAGVPERSGERLTDYGHVADCAAGGLEPALDRAADVADTPRNARYLRDRVVDPQSQPSREHEQQEHQQIAENRGGLEAGRSE